MHACQHSTHTFVWACAITRADWCCNVHKQTSGFFCLFQGYWLVDAITRNLCQLVLVKSWGGGRGTTEKQNKDGGFMGLEGGVRIDAN
ncbi:predicted protein [Plenodomus lingam JN3]|uniref:Predicted protein n=1 Tax=Leptosphaeria maculans (strain JN3 / isolate v23.1.3 / race Av1-4-5-6-7-8) TaxID=985895 RepID=E4ZTC7_LEPMJ|nr:predicted protein [Plenodomus lingam JN3]CBX94783.1 predicted protein [Plenodomus lingam JN3]